MQPNIVGLNVGSTQNNHPGLVVGKKFSEHFRTWKKSTVHIEKQYSTYNFAPILEGCPLHLFTQMQFLYNSQSPFGRDLFLAILHLSLFIGFVTAHVLDSHGIKSLNARFLVAWCADGSINSLLACLIDWLHACWLCRISGKLSNVLQPDLSQWRNQVPSWSAFSRPFSWWEI